MAGLPVCASSRDDEHVLIVWGELATTLPWRSSRFIPTSWGVIRQPLSPDPSVPPRHSRSRTANLMQPMAPSRKKPSCYACTRPATGREHVPPACLFPEPKDSAGADLRVNLITV